MPSASVIQLRQLLAEKFPGLRTRLPETSTSPSNCWPVGLSPVDELLQGGLPRGSLTEIVTDKKSSGSATLIHALLRRAAFEDKIITLIDGTDSFEVTNVGQEILSRLLWVRCHSVEESLKVADWILRDANLPLVLLDLKGVSEKQLHKVSATFWYRFQRLVEETAAVCLIFTPRPLVASASTRITFRSSFSLAALEREADELLGELKLEITDLRHGEARELFRNTA